MVHFSLSVFVFMYFYITLIACVCVYLVMVTTSEVFQTLHLPKGLANETFIAAGFFIFTPVVKFWKYISV